MRHLVLLLTAVLFCLLPLGALQAATPSASAQAVGVDPAAQAKLAAAVRTLVVGSDVSAGDTVITGPTGDVQLLFSDQTKLVVGPNSSLLIESYLMRSDGTAQTFAVNALAGTYRFITGNSAKSAYRIDTPTGSIGVRGTGFDFTVNALRTTLVLFHGAVRMCSTAGRCLNVTQTCGVAQMTGAGTAALSRTEQARQGLRTSFPFVRSQAGLNPSFRSPGSGSCLPAAVTQPRTTTARPSRPRPRLPTPGGRGSSGPTSTGGAGTTEPGGPVIVVHPPVHLPPRRPPVVEDPCARYTYLTPAERARLRREHIVCTDNNGSLIGNPIHLPPPVRTPPRGTGTTGTDGGGNGNTPPIIY